MLLSHFIQPMLAWELAVAKLINFDVEVSEKYLSSDNMFISIAINSLELLFDDGDINQEQHNKYRFACWRHHETIFFILGNAFHWITMF